MLPKYTLILLLFSTIILTACQGEYDCIIQNKLTFENTTDIKPGEMIAYLKAPYVLRIENYGFKEKDFYITILSDVEPTDIKYSFNGRLGL